LVLRQRGQVLSRDCWPQIAFPRAEPDRPRTALASRDLLAADPSRGADRVLPGQLKNAATAGVKLRSRVTVMWPRPLMRCRWLPAMSCAVCPNKAAL